MPERSAASRWFTALNLHILVVAILLIADLVLVTRLIVAWHDSHSDQSAQYDADLSTYGHLQARAAHLKNLPRQLSESSRHAQTFYRARVPDSDSAVLSELGDLTTRTHVRLSRAGYQPRLVLPGLVQLRIDASVSGDYTPVMHFINDIERDKNHAFFIIRSITLSGEQGGQVNLRMAMDTYIHADAAQAAALTTSPTAAREEQ